MANILPFILIVASLGVLIFIIVKNYPQLLLLDVETLPEVRDTKSKDRIIRKKSEQKDKQYYVDFQKKIQPFIQWLKNLQLKFRIFVGNVERKAAMETAESNKNLTKEEKQAKKLNAQELVNDADKDVAQEDYTTAEKKYLAALKQDPKNKNAYKGLAGVYVFQNQMEEAEETYKFLLHLDKDDEDAYLKLGEIYEEKGKMEKAVEYYQEAVIINPHNPVRFVKIYNLLSNMDQHETALEAIKQALSLEPQNPKYVDNFLETCIILELKDLAEDGYQQLRMINPENQKLVAFRQRIDEMKKSNG